MPEENIRVQTVLKPTSNISKDFVTNTMHFRIDHDGEGAVAPDRSVNDMINEVLDALETFYNNMGGAIFGGLSQTGHNFKVYRLDEPEPRFPRLERTWDFTFIPATAMLPAECAIVASFESFEAPGFKQASRRNRIYLGTLAAATSSNAGRIEDSVRTDIADAMVALFDDQDGAGFTGWTWIVYSPTLDTWAPVKAGHVDNAFDTQRRRGVSSTFRSTWGSTATSS